MIISFGSKQTKNVWNGERVPKWPIEIQKIGRRKLRMLHNSQNIADLRIPPLEVKMIVFPSGKNSGLLSVPGLTTSDDTLPLSEGTSEISVFTKVVLIVGSGSGA